MHKYSALFSILFLMLAPMVAAKPLTIERIFASPSLSGPQLQNVKLAPQGERVTFLRGKAEDREQLDLWEYHLSSGSTRMLVDSRTLTNEQRELSETEKARRERQRIAGLRGIVDYQWSADGKALLFMLQGDLFHYRLDNGAATRLTNTEAFETDPKLSPDGTAVAFIREQNLVVLELDGGHETWLTRDGHGTVHNGEAEFVAQEEMGRSSGYWWSPDSLKIAYIQYDEAPVEISKRYDIQAQSVAVIEQRYPYSGKANVKLRLGVVKRRGGNSSWVNTGSAEAFYLPRVHWLPDSQKLSYQWQPRDQQRLELRIVDVASMQQQTVLTETSETWVNLHDDLRFLPQHRFLWSSERDGYRHLYLYENNGRQLAQLTSGDWAIDELQAVDETTGMVFFTANKDRVIEQQLYSINYRDRLSKVQRISSRDGWHDISMNESAKVYVDTFSSRQQPPQVSLHDASGKRLTWLLENRLDQQHPYAIYLDQHQPTEFGVLKTTDRVELHYRMIKPVNFDATQQYPVFIYVYGGPHAQVVQDNWSGRLLIEQYMAQQGFVVFSLDNRGSARRGKAFEEALYRNMGTVEVQDQLRGVEFLQSLPYVADDKIGIFGWSYGGYMTLMSVLQAPDAYALGVAVAPVTDWHLYDTHYTERYMQTPQQNPAGYQRANVLNHTANLPADGQLPLLIMHGMADDNVLFTNTTMLFKDLQDKGKLYHSLTYPGARHGISGSAAQTHVYRSIARFFEQMKQGD
jgi:dipeptidyl-peptidase-4